MVFLIPVKMTPMAERRGDWGQMALISPQSMKSQNMNALDKILNFRSPASCDSRLSCRSNRSRKIDGCIYSSAHNVLETNHLSSNISKLIISVNTEKPNIKLLRT